MGLFGNKNHDFLDIDASSGLSSDQKISRIATLETERDFKQREIEELLFELGKKSGKPSIYNKRRLKKR